MGRSEQKRGQLRPPKTPAGGRVRSWTQAGLSPSLAPRQGPGRLWGSAPWGRGIKKGSGGNNDPTCKAAKGTLMPRRRLDSAGDGGAAEWRERH